MPEAKHKRLKLITLNTWSGLTYRGIVRAKEYESSEIRELRFRGLFEELTRINADVIVLNEVNPLPHYANRLAAIMNMDCMYHIGISGLRIGKFGFPVNLKEGDLILAKKHLHLKPLARTQIAGAGIVNRHFSYHTKNATQALAGVINASGKEVYIVATHLLATPAFGKKSYQRLVKLKKDWNYSDKEYHQAVQKLKKEEKAKLKEGEALLKFIKRVVPEDAPCFLLGDFNAEPDWPEISLLKENGFIDCFEHKSGNADPGDTWDPTKNINLQNHYTNEKNRKHNRLFDHLHALDEMDRRRIDFIFAKKVMTERSVVNSELCCHNTYKNQHISDHFGVFTEIKLEA